MKNFFKKLFSFLAVATIVAIPVISSADTTPNFWAKNAVDSISTNTGNGLANADIHVRNCYIGPGISMSCGTPSATGIVSINGDLTNAQIITGGAGINVATVAGTTTITNTSIVAPSPITIENGDSLFSTGLAGLWNSTATLSTILGVNAGDNADGATSFVAIGELAGASDNAVPYLPDYATMIGNRAGYNAHSAIDATFLGHLAGAYAEEASYSFFAGAQAGISATYAGNSFFFGQATGHNATKAAYSTFMGLEAGYDSTNGGFSNFVGNLAGFQATNANNATFIGSQAGRGDTVNNQGLITYTGSSGTFNPVAVVTSSSGGRAYVVTDNGAGNLTIMDSTGIFNPGDIVTEFPSGINATVSTYTPSTSSILIGDHTSTGGGKNSVAIGAHSSNAGYDNSIVIGVGGVNTMDNQYAWGDDIINWRFAGDNYVLPTVSPSGSGGQFLGVGVGNQLEWGVPGSNINSLTVLAATTTVLPNTPSYSNGVAGVGATLTAGSNGALVVDGITIPLNGRVLVKNQVATLQNGIYQLSTVGTGGVAYILTRTTDSDMASDFNDQVVIPAQGTQSATPFAEQNFVTTIGTDPIVYSPQTSLFVRQQAAGTQVANQIPIYTSTGLTITKGTNDFTYNPTTKVLILDGDTGNVFINEFAGDSSNNTFAVYIGSNAGSGSTDVSGFGSVGIGSQARAAATGESGVGIGWGAGASSTGNQQIAIGQGAGVRNTGLYATSMGISAGAGNALTIAGDSSVYLGAFAGTDALTSAHSIFIGDHAGSNDIVDNTVSGTSILIGENTSTGGFKNSIGIGEGATNTAIQQVVITAPAGVLFSTDYVDANVFIGPGAGSATVVGNPGNIYIGGGAGAGNITGATNIGIGFIAGASNTTQSDNISIGNSADTGGFSHVIALGTSAVNTANNQFMIGSLGVSQVDHVIISGTGGIQVPVGTTGERIVTQGTIRYNTTTSKFEGYDGSTWVDLN